MTKKKNIIKKKNTPLSKMMISDEQLELMFEDTEKILKSIKETFTLSPKKLHQKFKHCA